MRQRRDNRIPGVTGAAFFIRFALWVQSCRQLPDAHRVADRFGVSRATAYRLLQAWRDARGLPPAPRQLSKLKINCGYRPADQALQVCKRCVHRGERKSLVWHWCTLHRFPVQPHGVCPNFKMRDDS